MSASVSKKQQNSVQASKNSQIVLQATQENLYSGPIPPPEWMQGYENVQAGFADRIITMAENQSAHRQKLETEELRIRGRDSLLGIIFAFTICVLFIIAGVIVIIKVPDASIIGGLMAATGFLGTVVTSFISSTRNK